MEEKELNKEQNTQQENENNIPIEREGTSEQKAENQQSDIELKIAELESALQKIAELEKQNSELKDTLLRKVAEFENYKRRNENDQLNILKYAAESFIRNVLQVYDDLERSLSHIDDENNIDSTKKGLLLVFEKFGKILENQGVKKIDAKGKPFDVHLHEALMQQPAEGVAPHTVLDVLEPGYMYKDRVLRHAKVIVSSETASNEEMNSEDQSDDNQEG
ncbi:MAG: nucleotide exchange factor GrpE [Ignavibacteriales bacterium]|nr:MAG: nucleotide exchange factor GrpE [Ignavibacteriales bacterium]